MDIIYVPLLNISTSIVHVLNDVFFLSVDICALHHCCGGTFAAFGHHTLVSNLT